MHHPCAKNSAHRVVACLPFIPPTNGNAPPDAFHQSESSIPWLALPSLSRGVVASHGATATASQEDLSALSTNSVDVIIFQFTLIRENASKSSRTEAANFLFFFGGVVAPGWSGFISCSLFFLTTIGRSTFP